MSYTQEELEQFQCVNPIELFKRIVIDNDFPTLKNLKISNVDGQDYIIFHKKAQFEFLGVNKAGKVINIHSSKYLIKPLDTNSLQNTFRVKIIDSKLSGKFFGKKVDKRKMIGSIYNDFEIRYIKQTTIQDYTMCVRIIIEGESFTFAICDIEFLIPNLKGYNIPKDLSFKISQKVYAKKYKGEFEIVGNLYRNKTSKKINKRSNDRRRDVFACTQNGKIYHFFAEDLKHMRI